MRSYRCLCVASDALLASDGKAGLECLLFVVLVMKVYVCIFRVKAPGQIRSRALYYPPGKVNEGGEEDPAVNRDARAGLVEVVHQAIGYLAVEGLT